MNTARQQFTPDLMPGWVYDGSPEYAGIQIASASALEGGYILALKLASGTIRLGATRYPAKYLSTWRNNVKRYGIPGVVRVLIAGPYLRYEAVKRAIEAMLTEHKDQNSEEYWLDIAELTERAGKVFTVAGK